MESTGDTRALILRFPDDLFLSIHEYLRGEELPVVLRVCKKWQKWVQQKPAIWKRAVLRHPKHAQFLNNSLLLKNNAYFYWKKTFIEIYCYEYLKCSHCFRPVPSAMEPAEKRKRLNNVRPLCTWFHYKI
mmetsp:Transcript_16223/g.18366  ORF Transcript_16223/g.18366 Transcript_16223/m.18366 type:complete len:130 (-) Transcript_16223:1042-1431(-)